MINPIVLNVCFNDVADSLKVIQNAIDNEIMGRPVTLEQLHDIRGSVFDILHKSTAAQIAANQE